MTAVSLSPKSHSTPALSACASRRDQCASHRNARDLCMATVVKTPRPYSVAALTAGMRAFDASIRRRLRITCGCMFGSSLRARALARALARAGSIHESCAPLNNFSRARRPPNVRAERLETFYAERVRCILGPPNMPTSENVSDERKRPTLRVKLAVVAVSILVGLLVFEIFLRVMGFTYPVFYEPD